MFFKSFIRLPWSEALFLLMVNFSGAKINKLLKSMAMEFRGLKSFT